MDMKKILQALDTASSKPVEGSNDIKKSLAVITEAANPHKVSLPVQMAMSHFQTPAKKIEQKPSLLNKYFKEAEETLAKEDLKITCPNTFCGCGICVAKAKDETQFDMIRDHYVDV